MEPNVVEVDSLEPLAAMLPFVHTNLSQSSGLRKRRGGGGTGADGANNFCAAEGEQG